jgi:hypothetical protein
MAKQPGLDGRHRDANGQIHHKMGNTRIGTLRRHTEQILLLDASDMKLENLLNETGAKSLSDFRKTSTINCRTSSKENKAANCGLICLCKIEFAIGSLKFPASNSGLKSMSTSETDEYKIGKCPCGNGDIIKSVTTQDNPWSGADIYYRVDCDKCRENGI